MTSFTRRLRFQDFKRTFIPHSPHFVLRLMSEDAVVEGKNALKQSPNVQNALTHSPNARKMKFLLSLRTSRDNDGQNGEEYDLLCGALTRRADVVRRESSIDSESQQGGRLESRARCVLPAIFHVVR
jgi:hypothetical protein